MTFPFAIVGFDLDGTLVDSSPDLAAAVNHALAAADRAPLTLDAVRRLVGGGTRVMLGKALSASGGCSDATLDRLLPLLLDHYEAHIADQTRPYHGLIDALDDLAERGVRLAVVTNKLEHLARKLLDALGLASRFACIIGGDTAGPTGAKPAPDGLRLMITRCGGGRAAFVGDSSFDIRAAQAAELPSIAVSFGFPDKPVGELGANCVIDHYADLIPALETL